MNVYRCRDCGWDDVDGIGDECPMCGSHDVRDLTAEAFDANVDGGNVDEPANYSLDGVDS